MLNSLGNKNGIVPAFDKDSINIVFSFNDKYSKFFSVTLQSLICNSDNAKNYDIVVFSSDIKERSMKMLLSMLPQNFSLRFYSLTDFIQKTFNDIKLEEKDYWSVEMYYRIFIPIVMSRYEKALYLDSDTLINSSIDELFQMSFNDKQIMAVCDTTSPELYLDKNATRREHIKNILGLGDETKYFNSGMLLFNISSIEVNKYIEDILKVSQIDKLLYPDQDMLNVLFEKRVKLISSKWNYGSNVLVCNKDYLNDITEKVKQEFLESRKNPKIIHFISPIKPWNSVGEEFYETFWFYARKSPFYEEILYILHEAQNEQSIRKTNFYARLLTNKKFVLWGASIFLKEFIEKYKLNNENILGIIDKNSSRVGEKLGNYTIYAPEDLNRLNPDEVIISIVHKVEELEKDIKQFLKDNNLEHIKLRTL